MSGTVVAIAQIVSALGTLVAVVAALYIANKSRQEVQTDRRFQVQPVIVFEQGGYPISLRKREFQHRIPGCNPTAVEKAFKNVSATTTIILNDRGYGRALNIGAGPAIEVQVEFRPSLVKFAQESFNIDSKKKLEPRYSRGFNVMPLASVMAPNGTASLSRLPTFIVLDGDQRITYSEGELVIEYRDITGKVSETRQNFRYFNYFNDKSVPDNQKHAITFADITKIPLFAGEPSSSSILGDSESHYSKEAASS